MNKLQLRCLQIAYGLPLFEAKLLALLVEAPMADHEMITRCTEHWNTPAKLDILKLRRKVEGQGVKILLKFGLGYHLTRETKDAILAKIEDTYKYVVTPQSNSSSIERTNNEQPTIRDTENKETVQL